MRNVFRRALWAVGTFSLMTATATADLLISEYVEGSGFNKALEIYNTDPAVTVDLGADGCVIEGYQNGATTAGFTVSLGGTVSPDSVFTLAHTDADPALTSAADQISGSLNYNGDDAVALRCGGTLVDVVGQIGFDPGSEWGSGDTSTQNNTIRRQITVCTGDADGSDAFDPTIEWDGFAQNTFDGIGSHTANCGGPDVTPPTIVAITPQSPGYNGTGGTFSYTVEFSEPVQGLEAGTDITLSPNTIVIDSITPDAATLTSTYTVVTTPVNEDMTLTLNAGAVSDAAMNANTDTDSATVVFDDQQPTVVSTTPSTTGPTASTTITFTVVFNEPINDFDDAADVTINHSGTSNSGVAFNQTNDTTVVVTVSGVSGSGSFNLQVNADAVVDNADNGNIASGPSVDVTIDPGAAGGLPSGLLLSEVVVTPTAAEFIEITNTSAQAIDLSDVYLTDATFANGNVYYYQIVTGAGGGGGFGDFHARFPLGAQIGPGEFQTIALSGSIGFQAAYGVAPTYELFEDDAGADAVPDMLEAVAGAINSQGGLSAGEVAVLYYWDGVSDLVADLDYALWGDKVEAVDKTGIAIDGPDADAVASMYLTDTAVAAQAVIAVTEHAAGNSWQRVDFSEGSEIQSGGNGLDGHDETSENFLLTWGEGVPTPNNDSDPTIEPTGPSVLINEINAVAAPADEFIELFDGGIGTQSLDGLVLVLFNDAETSYAAIDLAGLATDASGYTVIGGASTSPDIGLPVELIDGVAAVAIYIGSATDFPNGTALPSTTPLDAVVYGTGQADDAGLLALLEMGQPQLNEDANMAALTESLQRCPNGSGGRRVTSTFAATAPSVGLLNNACPLGDYYANVDPSTSTTLRTTLHDTIDDHQWYPYTSSATDTWDILDMADEDPNDSAQILSVYLNASYPKAGGGNSNYNREHTWPRSVGLGETGTNLNHAATDAHNLRLSNIGYNSDRGSRAFATCDPMQDASCSERVSFANNGVGGGAGTYPGNSNWFTSGTDGGDGNWEVWGDRRGDVARTMFYMDIRYEGGNHGGTGLAEPDLVLTDNRSLINGTPGGTAYMGLLATLLQWHLDDPVDAKEQEHNELVFVFQGNRNPFVDHPEWVACLFENQCSVPPVEILFSDSFEAQP